MEFCTECGKENTDPNNQFCIYCGTKIEETDADNESITSMLTEDPLTLAEDLPNSETKSNIPVFETNFQNTLFCEQCGAPRTQDDVFCVNCGMRYDTGENPENPPKEKKRKKGRTAALIIILFLLAGTASLGIFALLNGVDSLPVIGQFFSQDDEEKIADESTEESAAVQETTQTTIPEETSSETTDMTEPLETTAPQSSSNAPSITATSELPEHPAAHIVDGDNNTAWASEVDTNGVWGEITIPYGADITVYGIYLKNGWWKSQYDLVQNSRAANLLIKFDDGSVISTAVTDSMLSNFTELTATDGELIVFTEPRVTSTLTITVNGAYPGANTAVFITDISVVLTPEETIPEPTVTVNPNTNMDALETLILDGASRYYTRTDITSLSEDEMRVVRNGLYALSGRIFKSPDLRDFFTSKDWYTPLYTTDRATKPHFNKYQDANLDLVVKIEKEYGYRD